LDKDGGMSWPTPTLRSASFRRNGTGQVCRSGTFFRIRIRSGADSI